ncbi:hypothetical protein NEDG_00290 [Nematocida displodere]|uniref:Uncharacterized protein n=1 Tax=Nematocida displodere TaxID=1805483 RepID=A0A177EIN4_9MICR|nr:hypothetical protein NEDG_00290 [Nematocida displodere]
MKNYKKLRLQKAKLCREDVAEIEFKEEERDTYLTSLRKCRVNARKKRLLEEKEEKKEQVREKKRAYKHKEKENADLAKRLLNKTKQSENQKLTIGDSVITIREL